MNPIDSLSFSTAIKIIERDDLESFQKSLAKNVPLLPSEQYFLLRVMIFENAALILAWCCDQGWNVHARSNKNYSLLADAIYMKSYESVCILVEHGVAFENLDPHGNSALTLAIMNKHYKIAHYLMDQGASLSSTNHYGLRAIDYVSENEAKETYKYMLEHQDETHLEHQKKNIPRAVLRPIPSIILINNRLLTALSP